MTSDRNNILPVANNVGFIDTAARGLLAGGLLFPVMNYAAVTHASWPAALALLSIYPLVTMACRWDPLYEWLGITSRRPAEDRTARMTDYVDRFRALVAAAPGQTPDATPRADNKARAGRSRAA